MQCEQCGGEVWDNSTSKFWYGGKDKEGNAKPKWTCKDKDGCGWKGGYNRAKPQGHGNTGEKADRGGKGQSRAIAPLYYECLILAKRMAQKELGLEVQDEQIVNIAATMFIAASRDGTPLMPSKAKPKPAPPPEPEDIPDEMPEYDDDLPF